MPCCSRNFSSRSCGGYLQYPASSCASPYPSDLVFSADLQCPTTYQLGSSLYGGRQEACCEPRSCPTPCVVSRPRQTACCRPRISTLCSPCRTTYSGSLGFGSASCRSLSYGSRSCYSGCGSGGFRSLGYRVRGFPSFAYGSGFCRPSCSVTRSCLQSSWYRPTCGSGFWRSAC